MVKNLPANAGDTGLIPGLGRSPGVGKIPRASTTQAFSCINLLCKQFQWQEPLPNSLMVQEVQSIAYFMALFSFEGDQPD